MNINYHRIILILTLPLVLSAAFFAQTKETNLQIALPTDFTYQGRLTDNSLAANGNYDFEFKLTDANGAVLATQQKPGVAVSNGIFTVRLDFGASSFTNGTGRFIEIGVRPVGTAAYTTLAPRQMLTSAPYAIFSNAAFTAQFANYAIDSQTLGGVAANQYVVTTDSRLSDDRNPLAGSGNYIQNTNIEQVANFSINGSGSAGILKAYNINAVFQYSLGGGKFITAPGTNNTFLGIGSGGNWTTGANNSFFGKDSGLLTDTGSQNSFFGASSGTNNTEGFDNSFFGYKAGFANTTAGGNSFFGSSAGASNSNGIFNSFFGAGAGRDNTTGGDNSFFGNGAGSKSNANANSFFGAASGLNNTAGSKNSFFGAYAGYNNTTGSDNAFFGNSAGNSNVAGKQNSFFGTSAGSFNTADNNSFFGFKAGEFSGSGTGNSFFGSGAGGVNTTGSNNTFIGAGAGAENTTGNNNIFIGNNAGQFTSPTASNNIIIGNNAVIGQNATNSIVIGSGVFTNLSNEVAIGGSQQNVFIGAKLKIGIFGSPGATHLCSSPNNEIALCSSSIRYKTDVRNFTSGLDLIRRLRPVTYNWKSNNERDLGFVAEEVNAVEPLMTTYNEKGEIEGVKYDRISTALVNAVGEQQTQIEAQAAQIKRQQTQIENQERELKLQQRQIDALKKSICSQNPNAEFCGEKESEK